MSSNESRQETDKDEPSSESNISSVPPPGQKQGPIKLTRRQRDVLHLVAMGQTNKEIARQLGVTEHTIEAHLRLIYQKLGVPNRGTAIRYAIENELD